MNTVGQYALAYLFWAISVVLAFVALLVWRTSAMIALGITQWDRYLEHALNQFGFLILAVVGLSVIVFAEHFYRTGVEKLHLLRRFLLLTGIEVLIIALAHLVQWGGRLMLGLPGSALLFVVELLISLACFLLYRRARAGTLRSSF
jgi:hypothetical protein